MTVPLDTALRHVVDRASEIQRIASSSYVEARILSEQAARLTQDVKRAVQRAALLRERARLAGCGVATISQKETRAQPGHVSNGEADSAHALLIRSSENE